MKKNAKYVLIIFSVILFIGLFMFALAKSGVLQAGIGGTGFFVLSSGRADFVSNDPLVGGKAWLVTVSQNGAGQSIVGTFSASDFVDTADGVNAKYPLQLSAELVDEKIEWGIRKSSSDFVQDVFFQRVNINLFKSWDTLANECKQAHVGKDPIFTKRGWTTYGYCYWFDNSRPHGEPSSDSQKSFSTKLSATVNGENVVGVINSVGQTSVWLGDKVYVSWVGSLYSGWDVSFPANTVMTWIPSEGKWRLTARDKWQVYLNQRSYALENCMASSSAMTYEQCFESYNGAVGLALVPVSFSIPGGDTASTIGSQTDGKVVLQLSKNIMFPVLSMKIRAEWIGIVQPVGMPKITGFGSQNTFKTGDRLNEEVFVKNVGDAFGSFEVYAECVSPLSSNDREQVGVVKGQTQSVFITIEGSTNKDTSQSCTFFVVDRNNPLNKDSKSKTYNLKTIVVCTPGDMVCNGNEVRKCSSDGAKFDVTQNCPNGCEVKSGVPVCKEGPVPPVIPPVVPVVCEPKLAGLIGANILTKESCDFFCGLGLKKSVPVNGCYYDYTLLFVLLGVVVFFTVVILIVTSRGKGKKGKPSKFWFSKNFWIIVAIIGAVFFLILFKTAITWVLIIGGILVIAYFLLKKLFHL